MESTPLVRLAKADEFLASLDGESVDAVITDPPFGLSREPNPNEILGSWLKHHMMEKLRPVMPDHVDLSAFYDQLFPKQNATRKGFMGHSWDEFVPGPETWRHAYAALKPGGHVIAFGGARTWDWTSIALRLAGFEKRDSIAWIHGGGMPRGRDMEKAIGKEWRGWNTALAPRHHPILVFRKPLRGTAEENARRFGTGLLNIDACRIADGRWPPNVTLDSPAQVLLDSRVGMRVSGARRDTRYSESMRQAVGGRFGGHHNASPKLERSPSAFFYCPRSSRSERNLGCAHLKWQKNGEGWKLAADNERVDYTGNPHPTVKPIALMRWLIRLVMRDNGRVVDPFVGSGTTGIAAILENMNFAGCDITPWAFTIAEARCKWAQGKTDIITMFGKND